MMRVVPEAGDMTKVALKARAYLPSSGVQSNSDIASVSYADGTLIVLIACSREQNDVSGLKITFPDVDGFRLLDEVDLVRYWNSSDFPCGSHLLEVLTGGWGMEENTLQGFEHTRREWLVVTGNACLSAFCQAEPELAEATWKFQV